MPTLAFSVEADYQQVIKFKQEISRLESELNKLDNNTAPDKIKQLETQLASCKEQMQKLIDKAAVAGKEFEDSTDAMARNMKLMSNNIVAAIDRVGGKLDRLNTQKASGEMEKLGGKAQEAGRKIAKEGDMMSSAMAKVGAAMAGVFAVDKAQEFLTKVAQIRGEFQKYEISFKTMLGSEEKAADLLEQLTKTAAITPFNMSDVTSGAKQLLAFGESAETVNDTLIRLGDIAAGTGAQIGQLTLVYGQVMAAGKLNGGDLIQFINAGVPIISELAKVMGVAEGKVKELISSGKVGFPEVQKALRNLTDEGSKFGGMMQEQSKTITGQWSSLQDAFDQMLNEIGKSSEGAFTGAISAANTLVENYEQVGRIIVGLIGTYGAYKAAVMTVTATETIRYQLALAHGQGLTTLGAITDILKAKTAALNAVMSVNPYVAIATALAAAVAVMWSMDSAEERVTKETMAYNRAQEEAANKAKARISKVNELISVIQNEASSTNNRKLALVQLEQKYPDIFAKYDTEAKKLQHILDIKNAIAELEGRGTAAGARKGSLTEEADALQKEINARKTGSKGKRNKEYEGISTQTLQDRLKARKASLAEVNKDIQKDNADKYLANLTGVSNTALAAQIKARKDLLTSMQLKGRQKGYVAGAGALSGEYSASEIQGQIQLLEAEQAKRTEAKKGAKEWGKEAQDAYRKALKAQQDFVNGKDGRKGGMSKEAASIELERLNAAVDAAKKEADNWNAKQDKAGGAAARKVQAAETAEREAEQRAGDMLASIVEDNERKVWDIKEDSLEKQRGLINAEYNKQIADINKKAREIGEANKKAGAAGLGSDNLTDEQRNAIVEAKELAKKQQEKQLEEVNRSEVEAMRDYLKEYGTYQQQKLAIAEEYAEKIRKAQTEGERLTLAKQRDSALSAIDNKAVQQQIDWQGVFGNLTGMLDSQLKSLLKDLQAYTKTEAFKSKEPSEQKTVYEAIEKLKENTSGEHDGSFGKLRAQFNQLGDAVTRYQAALTRQEQAQKDVTDAQEAYEIALRKGTKEEQQAAKDNLSKAKRAAEEADKALQESTQNMRQMGEEYRGTSDKTIGALNAVGTGLQNFASGSLKSAFEGLQTMVEGLSKLDLGKKINNALGKLGEKLSKGGFTAQLISAILGILDILKNGIGTVIASLIDTVLGAIAGILKNLLSGEFLVQVFNSITKGVQSILDAVTFGGFSSWITVKGNSEEVNATTERLTASNEKLKESIDKLKGEIAKGKGGAASISAAFEAQQQEQQRREQARRILEEQQGYHADHNSNVYYWDGQDRAYNSGLPFANFISELYRNINKLLKQYAADNNIANASSVGSQWDVYGLSPEELDYIRTRNREVWDSMVDIGKYDKSEYWNALADMAGGMDEITDKLNQAVTGTSFDSLQDSFADALLNMDSTAQDFSDNFTEYLTKAVMNAQVSNLLSADLKKFYEKFSNYMQTDKNGKINESGEGAVLDDDERKDLKNDWDAIVELGMSIRDTVTSFTGYDTMKERQASSGSFQGMSQDTGNELNGRFTALQAAGERIDSSNAEQTKNLIQMNVTLGELAGQGSALANIADDARDILASSYLELQEINLNTQNTVKALAITNERLQRIESRI